MIIIIIIIIIIMRIIIIIIIVVFHAGLTSQNLFSYKYVLLMKQMKGWL